MNLGLCLCLWLSPCFVVFWVLEVFVTVDSMLHKLWVTLVYIIAELVLLRWIIQVFLMIEPSLYEL